jgi:hypothetical protein
MYRGTAGRLQGAEMGRKHVFERVHLPFTCDESPAACGVAIAIDRWGIVTDLVFEMHVRAKILLMFYSADSFSPLGKILGSVRFATPASKRYAIISLWCREGTSQSFSMRV